MRLEKKNCDSLVKNNIQKKISGAVNSFWENEIVSQSTFSK